MNILKKTWTAFTSFLWGCLGTARSTGTPERAKRRLALKIPKNEVNPSLDSIKEAIRYRKRAHQLEAAADALRQIERLTIDDNYPMDIVDQKTINKIAQDAWRAAQK